MEFYRAWRILVGKKWLIIFLPLIATAFGLGSTYVLPEQYESTALVLVRPFESIKFESTNGERKELPDFPVNLSAPVDAPSKTYMEVIKSPVVARRIVEALHLDVPKPQVAGSEFAILRDKIKIWLKSTIRTMRNYFKYGRDIPASPFEQAVEYIESNIVVTARKDTYAFDIIFRASDPEEAASVANMAAAIFLEQNVEAYRGEAARAREFAELQLSKSRDVLDRARAVTLAFKSSVGTFDLVTEYNEKLKSLSDLQLTLAKDDEKLAGLRATRITGSPIIIAQSAEVAALRGQISALQAELVNYPEKQRRMDAISLTQRLAEKSYEFFLKNYEQARVKEAATASEIRVVSRGVPSLYPVKPIKYIYGGISFAVALIVAIAWALFTETLELRVRTISDLDDQLGLPVLGAIPRLRRSGMMVRI